MKTSCTPSTEPKSTQLMWGIMILLILGHPSPYLTGYRVPNWDLFKVMHVIKYLQFPDYFAGDKLTAYVTRSQIITAPIYYYGLAYPLSFFLGA